jgi:hypothetical protein
MYSEILTENQLPKFYVKQDSSISYMTNKITTELVALQKQSDKPKAVMIYASGSAIEAALKVSNEICAKFPDGLHRTTNSVLHITDPGETLAKENILDKDKLNWLMRGELGVKD